MWIPNNIIADVDAVARVYYIGKLEAKRWNEHRGEDELRLFTGWCWTEKSGQRFQQGLKTMSACYRDAWYVLVGKAVPRIGRPRVVRKVA